MSIVYPKLLINILCTIYRNNGKATCNVRAGTMRYGSSGNFPSYYFHLRPHAVNK